MVGLNLSPVQADSVAMGRSVIGFCAMLGATAGGFVPEIWGASSLSLGSLFFGVLGGIAGVWLGVRIADV